MASLFPPQLSLKSRITLSTLSIFLISIWTLAFYSSRILRGDIEVLLSEQQFSTVSMMAASINQELEDRLDALEIVAGKVTPAMQGKRASLQGFLENLSVVDKLFNGGVAALGPDGTVIAEIPLTAGRIGLNYMDVDVASAAALREGKSSIGKPVMGKKLRAPVFVMAVPIRDSQNRVVGALAGVINLGRPNFLDEITQQRYGKTGGFLLVAPQYQQIVTATDKSRVMEALPAPGTSPLMDQFIQGYQGSGVMADPTGAEVLQSSSKIPIAGWYLGAQLPAAEAFAPLRDVQKRVMLVTIALTLLAALLTWWMLRSQLSPLLAAANTLAAMSEKEQAMQALPISREDEIGQLIGGFNRLLEKLGSREKALQDSRERFDLAVRGSSDGIWDWNIQTGEIYVSERWCELLGYRSDEIKIGESTWANLIHPDDVDAALESMKQLFKLKKPYRSEYRIRNKQGEYRWFLNRGQAIWDEQGMAIRVAGSTSDVTGRKRAEETAQQQSRQLQLLHEASQRLNCSLNLQEIYQVVRDYTALIAPNDGFVISAFDAESQAITCRAYFLGNKWLDVSEFPPIPLEAEGRGTQSVAIRTGQPLLLNDYQTRVKSSQSSYFVNDETNAIVDEIAPDEEVTRSALIVPLKVGGEKVRGVIQVMSYRLNAFTDNQLKLLEALALHIAAAEQNALLYIQVQAELSERRAAEEQLRKLSLAVEQSPESIVITNLKAEVEYANEAFIQNSGYSREEIIGRNPRILHSGKTPRETFDSLWHAMTHGQSWKGEMYNRRKDGSEYVELAIITPIHQADGTITHYVAVKEDITARKAAENQIITLAFYDSLTNLPNRRLLLDRLQQALASSARSNRHGALLFIDLDNFKTLNDTLGHDIGDLLLQNVAQRLVTCVREGDTVARLGGDEFVVMLEDLSESAMEAATHAEIVGEKILAALNQPYQLASYAHHSTPSIGVTMFAGHSGNIEELLKRADMAMYQAKAAGRNTLRFFDPEMQAAVTARAALETDLHMAVMNEQFHLHFQPQVIGDHRMTGAEVLLRWHHPLRGMVSPAEFIPLAEETGLILPLGHWVLQTACRQLAAWAKRPEMQHLTIAVNVSARQLQMPNFVEEVLAILDHHGTNPLRLKLELTESLLVDNVEDVIAKMAALKTKGVGFSLDDFGTGYSSLSYLKRLPLDQLKIDQGFVRNILTDPNDAAIAKMVVALAESMGLSVIAEGVEIEAQRDFLARHGCHAYQGYLFSRPLPLLEFEALVQSV